MKTSTRRQQAALLAIPLVGAALLFVSPLLALAAMCGALGGVFVLAPAALGIGRSAGARSTRTARVLGIVLLTVAALLLAVGLAV